MPVAAEAARPALLGEVPSADGAAHRMRHVPPAHTVTRAGSSHGDTWHAPARHRASVRSFTRVSHCSGALCDKQDCSVNVYDTGGYLLCHDDVIGTRRHRRGYSGYLGRLGGTCVP